MLKFVLVALSAGLLFGYGLALSALVDPAKVIGFLDVSGAWDPTLMFVMAGAVVTTLITFRFILRLPRPLLVEKFHVPTRADVDTKLLLGSAIFGVGWGLAGYCPGPAIASLSFPSTEVLTMVGAMIAGSLAHRWWENRSARGSEARSAIAAQEE